MRQKIKTCAQQNGPFGQTHECSTGVQESEIVYYKLWTYTSDFIQTESIEFSVQGRFIDTNGHCRDADCRRE